MGTLICFLLSSPCPSRHPSRSKCQQNHTHPRGYPEGQARCSSSGRYNRTGGGFAWSEARRGRGRGNLHRGSQGGRRIGYSGVDRQ